MAVLPPGLVPFFRAGRQHCLPDHPCSRQLALQTLLPRPRSVPPWGLLGPWLRSVIAFNCRRNVLSLKFSAVGGGRLLQLGSFLRPRGRGPDLLVGTHQLNTLEVQDTCLVT